MRSEEQQRPQRDRPKYVRSAARLDRLNKPPVSLPLKLAREAAGRCVMLAFGLAMLYGGYRCFLLAWDMYNAPLTGDDYQSPVVKLPAFIGIALVPIGGLLALFAVLPIKAMDRFRPTMTMGENDVE